MPKRGLLESVSSQEENEEGGGTRDLGEMSGYERQRLEKIEENRKRMEAMGLKKMANSLMGSVKKIQKMKYENKGKRKVGDEDEDEEYNPTQEDDEPCTSEEEDEEEEVFSLSRKHKVKRYNLAHKKSGSNKKLKFGSGFTDDDDDDDDDALMQAIALSLQGSSGFLNIEGNLHPQVSETPPTDAADTYSVGKRKPRTQDDAREKKKKKKLMTSRVQMTEDEMIIHFFHFDEIGKGGMTLRDIQRVATAHDFTWSEKEMSGMISFFDSDGDGKINLDEFRKIVGRCNMLKGSDDG